MPRNTPIKPASQIALKAEQRLHKTLVHIGSDEAQYHRCFRTGNGRQLALNRVNAGIDVWTEPVWEQAAPFHAMRKKRYAADENRISNLEANPPRLSKGIAADYWRFPALGDLYAFIDWYKTL
ncbi:hypothetical protein [Xanthomonas sp. WHRI 7065]|uniref:hypothetical protein n=1 Tax=Xanthomonas sp. WHRI 7065 TaxID=3161569 RepID=UPI0032E92BC3